MLIKYEIPVKTVSEANIRCHWAVRARRAKAQRHAAYCCTQQAVIKWWKSLDSAGKITVTLTRLGKRKLDSDNLASSCKALRDGIAQALNVNDGDERITWNYAQLKDKSYSVLVEIKVQNG